jgi:hypothetical protein
MRQFLYWAFMSLSIQAAQVGQVIPGEYLVRSEKSIEQLQRAFSSTGFVSVSRVEPGLYLLRFEKDPGLDVLVRLSAKEGLGTVQPNFRYSTQPGSGGLHRPVR